MNEDIGREDTELWWQTRELAYALYEERCRNGQEHSGDAVADWLQAEGIVKGEQ